MDWWNSFEAVSKVQTGLAVALAVLAFVTLTFKIRGDHLRKTAAPHREEDRTATERKAEPKAPEVPAAPEPTVLPSAEAPRDDPPPPVADVRRHFPKEKTEQFLQVLSNGITGPTPLTLGYVDADDGEPRQFASEFATLFGGDPASMTVVAPTGSPMTGILIQDSPDAQAPSRFASNLMAAFEAVGFKCTYGKDSPKPGVVRIVVGTKE
jgi:hypothetical protein